MLWKPSVFSLAISAIALCAPLNSAFAGVVEGPHADIYVWAEGAQLRTASWDHGTDQVIDPSARVFSADLGADPDFPFAIDEPGIGSNLVGATLNMYPNGGMSRWTGNGLGSSDHVLSISYGGQSANTIDSGFISFLVIDDLDLHPDYSLAGSQSSVDPDPGIYVATFRFEAEGFDPSAPLWVVFNLGSDEADHDAAIEWVQANLVPAPGALSLLALMGARSGRRRRA
ncbi:MAG: hypothetical protein EBR10_02890 [Planctomycetes bacterium]|nr:hypothetical protein [Planctomycetota bacterium]